MPSSVPSAWAEGGTPPFWRGKLRPREAKDTGMLVEGPCVCKWSAPDVPTWARGAGSPGNLAEGTPLGLSGAGILGPTPEKPRPSLLASASGEDH